MHKSNRPLICGENLFWLFLWQIFTECSFYTGLCAECWGYRHKLDSLIPQGVTRGLVRETDILRGELRNNVESTSTVDSCRTVSKVVLREGGGAPSETWDLFNPVALWCLRSLPRHHIGWAPFSMPTTVSGQVTLRWMRIYSCLPLS